MKAKPKAELIWASPRELLNIFQADAVGCHIITATNDILKKLSLVGKDLDDYSLETVEMFYKDAEGGGLYASPRARPPEPPRDSQRSKAMQFKNVLVTGGAGYVGSLLTAAAARRSATR